MLSPTLTWMNGSFFLTSRDRKRAVNAYLKVEPNLFAQAKIMPPLPSSRVKRSGIERSRSGKFHREPEISPLAVLGQNDGSLGRMDLWPMLTSLCSDCLTMNLTRLRRGLFNISAYDRFILSSTYSAHSGRVVRKEPPWMALTKIPLNRFSTITGMSLSGLIQDLTLRITTIPSRKCSAVVTPTRWAMSNTAAANVAKYDGSPLPANPASAFPAPRDIPNDGPTSSADGFCPASPIAMSY